MYKQLIESILDGTDSVSEEIFKKIIYKKSIKLVEQMNSDKSPVVVKDVKHAGGELKDNDLLVFSFNFAADVDLSHVIKEYMSKKEIAELGSNSALAIDGNLKIVYNTNIEKIHYKTADWDNLFIDYVGLEMVYYTLPLKHGYAYYEGDEKYGLDSDQSDEHAISEKAINYIKTLVFKEFKNTFPDLKQYAYEFLTDWHNGEEDRR